GGDERIEIVRQIEHVHILLDFTAVRPPALEFEFFAGLENFGRRSPGNHGFEFAAVAQAASESWVIDQFADRDLSDLNFVIAWPLDVPAEADDARARVVRRPEAGEFHATHRDDMFDRAEGFDVVDDGGAHV